MNWIRSKKEVLMSLTIKRLLIIGMGITIGTIMLLLSITIFNISRLSSSKDMVFSKMKNSADITDVSKIGTDLYRTIAATVINLDFGKSEKEWSIKKEKALRDIERMAEIADTAEEKELVAKSRKGLDEMIRLYENELLPLVKQQTMAMSESIMVLGEAIDKEDAVVKENLMKLSGVMNDKAKTADEDFESTRRGTNRNSIIVGFITLIILTVIWLINIRKIAGPLSELTERIKDIATGEGDLTKRLLFKQKDEIGEVSRWFDTFVEKIHDIVVQISHTTQNIASNSEQLSASATQIAKGTASQTERATTVATSSEEMSATVIEVAKNASGASESAKDANKVAQKGKDMVERTVSGMNDIASAVKESASVITQLGSRSNEIGEIIKVIDDIADQTNLLALNAAIEAARAGEHGRGFAVVADEVRKLAEKTTKATKEIGGMIGSIQDETGKAVGSMGAVTKEVEEEVKLAKDAGSALNEIVSNVDKLTGQIQQIAVASEEQSAATDQISRDIQDIANTTKETSASSTQIADASNNLAKLATNLQGIVGQFKI